MSEESQEKLMARCHSRARIIKALAHPSRLRMIEEIARNGQRCVCELAELVGLDMSTASRHLSQLKEAGILEDERRGQMTFYRLRTRCVLEFLQCIDRVVQEGLERQLDVLR
jgi:ArsR family transcriptional regulator